MSVDIKKERATHKLFIHEPFFSFFFFSSIRAHMYAYYDCFWFFKSSFF